MIRTLYWAHVGARCVGWWDTKPPPVDIANNRCPRFRAPDIYHDRLVGTEAQVIADFARAGVLPASGTYRLINIPQDWVVAGLRALHETKVKRRQPKPNPEKDGLFSSEYVKPVSRDGVPG